jgi:hypothetical protein
MLGINIKHVIASAAVAGGLLAAAGPASAASVYQHNQTDLEFLASAVTDGTSNTIMFGELAARGTQPDRAATEPMAATARS